MIRKNCFGQSLFIKKWLIRILGLISYRRFYGVNKLQITGSEIIRELPETNVLFVSNHETYFADATAMFHVFNAALNGENNIQNKKYLWNPKLNLYFIAAKETMQSGILPKILSYAGSISIERTWREKGKSIKRKLNMRDIDNVGKAINDGWVITFPQGTTTPWKPVRRGTAYIIKQYKPVVVPVVVCGFRKVFGKKGLSIKTRGEAPSIQIKDPLNINYEENTIDEIVEAITVAIEQIPLIDKS